MKNKGKWIKWINEETKKLIILYNSKDPYYSFNDIGDILERTWESCKRKIGRIRKNNPKLLISIFERKSLSMTGENNPMYGRKHSEMTKEILAKKKIGKSSWNKGKKMSDEIRKNMSISKIGMYAGDKHPRWKGGISNTYMRGYRDEFFENRKKIRKIHNNQCAWCKKTDSESRRLYGQVLHCCHLVHNFIFQGKEYIDNSIENLILLCPKCHGYLDNRKYTLNV